MRGKYLAIETTIMKVVSFVVGIIGRFFVLFAQFSLTRHTAVDKDRKVHFQTKKNTLKFRKMKLSFDNCLVFQQQ